MSGKRGEKYKIEEVCHAVKKAHGFLTVAAKALGCSVQTVMNYRRKHPEIEEVIMAAREETCDLCESQMRKKIISGDTTMMIFYAKTQMRGRGYGESMSVDNTHRFVGDPKDELKAILDQMSKRKKGDKQIDE